VSVKNPVSIRLLLKKITCFTVLFCRELGLLPVKRKVKAGDDGSVRKKRKGECLDSISWPFSRIVC
jgi:hypothetical protein